MGTTTDKLNAILNTKENIKQKLIEKGVIIGNNLPFSHYADKIDEISGGSTIVKLNESYSISNRIVDKRPVVTEHLNDIVLSYGISVTDTCEISVTESEG